MEVMLTGRREQAKACRPVREQHPERFNDSKKTQTSEDFMNSLLRVVRAVVVGAIVGGAGITPAFADDLKLLCAGAMHTAVEGILARQRSSSPKVDVTAATAGAIRERIEKGEQYDVVIAPKEGMDYLVEKKAVDGATRHPLGETEIGVAVKQGAPKPDISTPDKLKAALLAAKKVVIVDPTKGTSGRLLVAMFKEMGIDDQVEAKLLKIDGGRVTEAVARGEADLGFQQVSEILPVKGVTLIGTLPGNLKKVTRYDVAATTAGAAKKDARALFGDLTSSDAYAEIKRSGFTPLH
jgi:molybdate transport system substrate-binding protein